MTEIESWDDDPDFASDADNVSLFAQSIATTTTSADTTPDDDFFEGSLDKLNSLSLNPSSNSPLLNKSTNTKVHQLGNNSNNNGSFEEYEDDFDLSPEETDSEFQTIRPSHLSSLDQNQTIRAPKLNTIRPSIQSLVPENNYEHQRDVSARSFSPSSSALYDFDDFSSFENDLEIDPDTDLADLLQRKSNNIDPKSSFSSVEQSSLRTPSSAREEDDFWNDFELDPTEEPETIFRKKAPEITVNPKHPYISSTIAFHPKIPQETKAYPMCKEIFPSLSNEQEAFSNTRSSLKQPPKSQSKHFQNGVPYAHDTIRASQISSSSKKNSPGFATWNPTSLKQEAQNPDNLYLDINDLKLAAKTSKYKTRPRHVRKYGDGTELDGLEDLPVNYDYENEYQDRFRSPVRNHSHNPALQSSPSRNKRNENLLSNITNIQRNDARYFKGNGKSTVTPSKEMTLEALSNDQLNSKTLKYPKKKREPTLIKNLSSPKTPKLVGKMRYNPAKQCWEGNDHAIRDFDAPLSPSRPALISNISAKKGIQVVGNMVFDPTRFRWINNADALEEEPDPFAGLDDLENEDSVSQLADNTNDTVNKSMNSLYSLTDTSEIYDVGPEFEKKQYAEEKLWRKWVDGWYLSTKKNNMKRLWELYNILNAEQ
ncbi:two-component GAP Byr4 [Schizosaccharomyces octosporus yFS286]|uniref:Two-component GAP Byr4 n=1 Tax=Schizosaccharomyces octosporus (strain yFS286) TaxID=483514 RepID=S9Q017_SCHOY|nr:two-component GAP Byr4 [Schizosaccharomyces octosporus yFS286]EPX74641.1 two-component GAP Byr4 [Schizosaccharomyces octosporus yFS286]